MTTSTSPSNIPAQAVEVAAELATALGVNRHRIHAMLKANKEEG